MKNILLPGLVAALLLPAAAVAREAATPLDYHGVLMEYYAGYCGMWGDREVEECCIAFHPDRYAAHEKDEARRKEDRELVRGELKEALAALGSAHEYGMLMHAQLGDYDREHGGFRCDFAEPRSYIELGPLRQNMPVGREQSVIVCGLVFDRVHTIKIFFANTEEYNFLKYPVAKADRFLAARTSGGTLNKEVYIRVVLKILPASDQRKHQLDELVKNTGVQGMASSYFVLAAIDRIEVYDDPALKTRLGNVERFYRTLEVVH